jgi:hypothetical protein
LSLNLLRRWKSGREKNWLKTSSDLYRILTPDEARGILKKHSDEWKQILNEADEVLSGWTNVPGFGRRRLELDWCSSFTREEAYAYRLLTRLDFLKPLTRTALIAEDPGEYIAAVENILLKWRQVRAMKTRWDSVDEAIRALNLIETLTLLAERLKPKAFQAGLETLLSAAWMVQANRARTGNHLIYEGLALFYAGCSLKNYYRSKTWKRLGAEILKEAMRRQVLSDGMNAERNTGYHLITGTNFLKAWAMGRKVHWSFPGWFNLKLAQMAVVAYKLQAYDGSFFAIGDSDRMTGFSREEKEARAFAELGNIIARPSEDHKPGLELDLLLTGLDPGTNMAFDASDGSSYMQAGGYHILRYRHGKTLIFDTGPLGLSGASHHGHADTLSFIANLHNSRFLVDSGGFSYVDEEARRYARSTAAHNTVRVDGADSSEIIGSFGFGRGADATLTDMFEFEGGTVLSAEHDGYAHLKQPVVHRRALIWLIEFPFFLIVLDRLEGEGEHLVEAFFHADSDWTAQKREDGSYLWTKENHRVQHRFRCNLPCEDRLAMGEKEPEWQGWVSPAYGRYLEAPVLIESCRGEMPVEIVNAFFKAEDEGDVLMLDGANNTVDINGKLKLCWKWDFDRLRVKLDG